MVGRSLLAKSSVPFFLWRGNKRQRHQFRQGGTYRKRFVAKKSPRETERKASSPPTVPVAVETARIRKRQVVKGKVRVRTITETAEELIETTAEDHSVEVVRIPVDRIVREVPSVRTEDGVTIVPILEERVVVQTQLVLKEELRIRRLTEIRTEKFPVRLRKQRAIVERIPGEPVADQE